MLLAFLSILTGYLLGAIPFGYLVAKARGVDILKHGSGNIGATNVGRVLGRGFGLLVFLLDFLKGALPTLSARLVTLDLDWPPNTLAVATGVAAFVGHLFPIYLSFRGGKGVATGAGVVAVLLPLPFLGSLGVWLAVVLATRTVSLASILACVYLLAQRLLLTSQPWNWDHAVVSAFCVTAVVLVIARHQANIRRLWQGTENQLKESNTMRQLAKVIHVLALGTCFGAQVFFTITGLVIFQAFEQESRLEERPLWFPLPPEFKKEPPAEGFPNPLRLEQGSRAGGVAVTPLFSWYYGLQTVCVILALSSAWTWRGRSVDRLRRILLVITVALLGVGWWLDHVVHDLRGPRNNFTEEVIRAKTPSTSQIDSALAARKAFGTWHGLSLLQNFATLLLVGIALGLASSLPTPLPDQTTQTKDGKG